MKSRRTPVLPLLNMQYASSRRPCYITVILSPIFFYLLLRLTYCPEFTNNLYLYLTLIEIFLFKCFL